jgi:UDP-N-acetylglucosamine 2-epimerase (non-hydrolysing)
MAIFGTRPEVIKIAPIIRKLKELRHQVIICVTAQHRKMLVQSLALFV